MYNLKSVPITVLLQISLIINFYLNLRNENKQFELYLDVKY